MKPLVSSTSTEARVRVLSLYKVGTLQCTGSVCTVKNIVVIVYNCNHCSNLTWVVVEDILAFDNRLRSTHVGIGLFKTRQIRFFR